MTEDEQKSGGAKHWRLVILIVLLVGLGVMAYFLPVRDYVVNLINWTEGLGAWGYAVVGGAYMLATVLMISGAVFTVGCGFLFGVVKGTVLASIASTIGATIAFFVGRFLARD